MKAIAAAVISRFTMSNAVLSVFIPTEIFISILALGYGYNALSLVSALVAVASIGALVLRLTKPQSTK
jgi:hypothetical protein